MTNAGFFRGTSAEQDFRFSNKQSKSRKEFKFPPLDTTKINIESLKPWILDKIKNVLKNDDDLMSDAILEFFSEKEVDGSAVSQFISGFADAEKTNTFIQEVWTKFNEVKEEPSTSKLPPSTNDDKFFGPGVQDKAHEKQEPTAPLATIDDSIALLKPFLKKVISRSTTSDKDTLESGQSLRSDDEHVNKPSERDSSNSKIHKKHHKHRDHDHHSHRHRRHRHREHHRQHHRSSREPRRRSRDRSSRKPRDKSLSRSPSRPRSRSSDRHVGGKRSRDKHGSRHRG